MKNTENARKLKRIPKEKGKDTALKSKPLHGQYPLRSQKANVDLHGTHQWLKAKTEGVIVATQDEPLHQTLGVDSVIQAPRRLTTSSQGALFLPQMSIQRHPILLDNIYIGKSVTIMILKHPVNGTSMNRYLLWVCQKWSFFGTSQLELTKKYKLTGQI